MSLEKSSVILDVNVLRKAEAVFKQYDLSVPDAINMFVDWIIEKQKLPFKHNLQEEPANKLLVENYNVFDLIFEQLNGDWEDTYEA